MFHPLFAEEIASNINWSLIASLILTVFTGLMWWDARKQRVTQIQQPFTVTGSPLNNAEIQRDLKAMNHRLVSLEQWRGQILDKMEEDKNDVIRAGEHRAEKIHERINAVLTSVSELKGTIHEMQRHDAK